MYVYVYVYIYIYREREREIDARASVEALVEGPGSLFFPERDGAKAGRSRHV